MFVHVHEQSCMNRQLGFCIGKLRNKEGIQIGGLGVNIPKVIQMVEIVKERLGWLHQITNFTTRDSYPVQNEDIRGQNRRIVGIIVELSRTPLDKKGVGYQRPKSPIGYMERMHYLLFN
jgi:hypothetical protein